MRRIASTLANIQGHAWTLAPNIWRRLRPLSGPPETAWATTLTDPALGEIRLRGIYHCSVSEKAGPLLVILHGLGGSHARHYCLRAANAAQLHGWSSLRVSLRGADRSGEDVHHAGLIADLDAVFASPALAAHRDIFVLGYSLGGHVALRYACERADSRVRALAVVCTPLDLARAGAYIDSCFPVYRRHLLNGLKEIFRLCVKRGRSFSSWESVRRSRTLREFDQAVIVPRFDYPDVEAYYARESVVQHLSRLRVPTLFCASMRDPMLPAEHLRHSLRSKSAALDVRWIDAGGHVNFPRRLDLGERGATGLEAQILGWMSSRY